MIFIPFFVLFFTEICKVIIQSIQYKKFDLSWFLHAGGMPSGHAAFTSSIATVIAYMKGYNSPEFLIALGFAIIVMYDARGVRNIVGKQSTIINTLDKKANLEIYVGHTNWQVFVGAALGISFSVAFIRFGMPLLNFIDSII